MKTILRQVVVAGTAFVSALALCTPASAVTLEVASGVAAPESSTSAHHPAPQGTLVLTPTAGEGVAKLEPIHLEVTGFGDIQADLPAGTWWWLEPQVEGWWARGKVVSAEQSQVPVELLPTGDLSLRVKTEGPAPDSMRVRFSPAIGRRAFAPGIGEPGEVADPLEGESACKRTPQNPEAGAEGAESEEGEEPKGSSRWICAVPASRALDVKVRAPGFASAFFTDVMVRPGAVEDLGTQKMTAGGSVLGWVEIEGTASSRDAVVQLKPASAGIPTSHRNKLGHHGAVGERGFFQVEDLPPGSYEIQVWVSGWPPTRHGSVKVLAGRETELQRPIRVGPPSAVRICVQPTLPPGFRKPGEVWTLQLSPPKGEFRNPLGGDAGADGCWSQSDVAPGEYWLRVKDERQSQWHEERVSITPGEWVRTVDLDLLGIAGTVRGDGEPTRAVLRFDTHQIQDEQSLSRRRVYAITNPEGDLKTALPFEGEWRISARLTQEGAFHDLGVFDIREPEDGEATLDLEIPGGVVRGQVVTEDGEPAPLAHVSARPVGSDARRPSSVTADEEGRFEFHALSPGEYKVSAFSNLGSGEVTQTVSETAESEPLEIVLAGMRNISGRVVAHHGPVAGASVLLLPYVESPRQIPLEKITTDHQGRFNVSIPTDSTLLDVLILPPGFSTSAYRLPPPSESSAPLTLPVDEPGGTILLRTTAGNLLTDAGTLTVNGQPLWLPQLQNWTRLGGGARTTRSWVLPQMGSGEYRWCSRDGDCDSGFLPPAGRLELRVQ